MDYTDSIGFDTRVQEIKRFEEACDESMREMGREVRDILEMNRISKELAEENARLNEKIKKNNERINERNKRINERNKRINERNERINERNERIKKNNEEINELMKNLFRKNTNK